MIILILFFVSLSQSLITTYKCGSTVNCTFDNESRIFTVSGEGDMMNYTSYSSPQQPYVSIRNNVKAIIV